MNENVIPWEQIEPLFTPGMKAVELGDAILSRLGLTRDEYQLRVRNTSILDDVMEGLRRHGVVVEKLGASFCVEAGEVELR